MGDLGSFNCPGFAPRRGRAAVLRRARVVCLRPDLAGARERPPPLALAAPRFFCFGIFSSVRYQRVIRAIASCCECCKKRRLQIALRNPATLPPRLRPQNLGKRKPSSACENPQVASRLLPTHTEQQRIVRLVCSGDNFGTDDVVNAFIVRHHGFERNGGVSYGRSFTRMSGGRGGLEVGWRLFLNDRYFHHPLCAPGPRQVLRRFYALNPPDVLLRI